MINEAVEQGRRIDRNVGDYTAPHLPTTFKTGRNWEVGSILTETSINNYLQSRKDLKR